MDTIQLFNSRDHDVPIDKSIWNYYYKKNIGGEHMKQPHSHNAIEIECIVDGHLFLEFKNEWPPPLPAGRRTPRRTGAE